MKATEQYLKILLHNISVIRERAGMSVSELENRMILGPGWITRFETGETVPNIDMILAILHETNSQFSDLLIGLPDSLDAVSIERFIHAEQSEQNPNDLVIRFRYANFDASYTLPNATVAEFAEVIKTLRDGLSKLALAGENSSAGEAIKCTLNYRSEQLTVL